MHKSLKVNVFETQDKACILHLHLTHSIQSFLSSRSCRSLPKCQTISWLSWSWTAQSSACRCSLEWGWGPFWPGAQHLWWAGAGPTPDTALGSGTCATPRTGWSHSPRCTAGKGRWSPTPPASHTDSGSHWSAPDRDTEEDKSGDRQADGWSEWNSNFRNLELELGILRCGKHLEPSEKRSSAYLRLA